MNLIEKKKKYYSSNETVNEYINLRYDNYGGKYVLQNENDALKSLIDESAFYFDIPAGYGRINPILKAGFVSCDYSFNFLKINNNSVKINCDIFHLPFKNNSIKNIISLRFFFHFNENNIALILSEFKRVLQSGGTLIFNFYSWTPMVLGNYLPAKFGGKSFGHSEKKIKNILKNIGFSIETTAKKFLLPPFIYTFLPKFFIKIISIIEQYKFGDYFKLDYYYRIKK